MLDMNLDSLQKYIRNLKQLQQTMKKMGLEQATAAAGENIRIAEKYLTIMEKTRSILKRKLERKG